MPTPPTETDAPDERGVAAQALEWAWMPWLFWARLLRSAPPEGGSLPQAPATPAAPLLPVAPLLSDPAEDQEFEHIP